MLGSKLKPFIGARLDPNRENQTHEGVAFNFKGMFEKGGGYKNLGYSYVLLVVKTMFELTAAYDFEILSRQTDVTKK